MSRVKTGFTRHRRHKNILKATKGYFGARSKLFKTAHEAYLHAGEYAFAGRRLRKRDFRKLWIQRINAALKPEGISYSAFINQLKLNKIELNRKILADLAIKQPAVFKQLVQQINAKK